jgi:predicted enzyme related to lactoylglutathione lyase
MPATATKLSIESLGYIIQFVPDMKAAIAFYRDTLGMKLKVEDEHWTEFETKEGVIYALHPCEQHVPTQVTFGVSDIAATREALLAAGVQADEPKVVCEFDGKVGLSVEFKDPAGNALSVFGIVAKDAWKE